MNTAPSRGDCAVHPEAPWQIGLRRPSRSGEPWNSRVTVTLTQKRRVDADRLQAAWRGSPVGDFTPVFRKLTGDRSLAVELTGNPEEAEVVGVLRDDFDLDLHDASTVAEAIYGRLAKELLPTATCTSAAIDIDAWLSGSCRSPDASRIVKALRRSPPCESVKANEKEKQMTNVPSELALTDEPVAIGSSTNDDEAQDVPQVPQQFSIKDTASASWLTRRLNECRAYSARVRAWADREVKRAERDEEYLLMRYGRQLEDYAAGEIARLRGRRRSIALPGGDLGFRRVGPTLVFDNPEAVMRWAKRSCPQAIVTKGTLSKVTVNEHVETTGELPDGAHIEAARDKFYFK